MSSAFLTKLFLCPQRNCGRHIKIALSIPPSARLSVHQSVRPASCPVHISYILLGRNSKFGVWMHIEIAKMDHISLLNLKLRLQIYFMLKNS